VFALTAVSTGLHFVDPHVVPSLMRTPDVVARREWWRWITPFFVNRGGWLEIGVNLTLLAVLGAISERIFGARRWLFLYVAAGIVGEVAGYAWKPVGAGSSVAIAGLLGGVAAWLLFARKTPAAIVAGSVVAVGALALTASRDLHGPPILAGFFIACATIAPLKGGSP
jgi:rhomboid protease GluP